MTDSTAAAVYAPPLRPACTVPNFYLEARQSLDDARLSYLVGGAYARTHYTGLPQNQIHLEIYVRADDHRRVLNTLAHAGYRTEYVCSFCIAKALCGDDFIEIVYGSGNGVCVVDDDWFTHAVQVDVLGTPTRLCPPEEQIWIKAFGQNRQRDDDAEVAHIILRQGPTMDWQRILRRFHHHERVLLSHCILFGYAYPTEKLCIPDWVLDHLYAAARHESDPSVKLCRGPILSQTGYTTDITDWGYVDGRLQPYGRLTQEQIDELPHA